MHLLSADRNTGTDGISDFPLVPARTAFYYYHRHLPMGPGGICSSGAESPLVWRLLSRDCRAKEKAKAPVAEVGQGR